MDAMPQACALGELPAVTLASCTILLKVSELSNDLKGELADESSHFNWPLGAALPEPGAPAQSRPDHLRSPSTGPGQHTVGRAQMRTPQPLGDVTDLCKMGNKATHSFHFVLETELLFIKI